MKVSANRINEYAVANLKTINTAELDINKKVQSAVENMKPRKSTDEPKVSQRNVETPSKTQQNPTDSEVKSSNSDEKSDQMNKIVLGVVALLLIVMYFVFIKG